MTEKEMVRKISAVLDDSKTGVLATVDEEGDPRMRWMTPVVLPSHFGALFAVTSPRFAKIAQLDARPRAEWMLQTRALTEVLYLRCTVRVIDNPSLRKEVVETLGTRLTTFWKQSREAAEFVVLESSIRHGTLFMPMKGTTVTVVFGGDGS